MQNRRQMLAGMGGAALLCTGMQPASAEAPGNVAAGPFLVKAGQGRDEPLQIAGSPFESAKVSSKDVKGRYTLLALDTPPGRGPALHIHHAQNEWFYMLGGSIGLQCGEQRVVLHTGDSFLAPQGVPHAYVTLGSDTAHILNLFDPAGDIEAFFVEYAKVLNLPGTPDNKRLDALSAQHGMTVVGPPLRAAEFHS